MKVGTIAAVRTLELARDLCPLMQFSFCCCGGYLCWFLKLHISRGTVFDRDYRGLRISDPDESMYVVYISHHRGVGIVNRPWYRQPRSLDLIPSRGKSFHFLQKVETVSGLHATSHSLAVAVLTPGIKRLERAVNHVPSSSAEGKIEWSCTLHICLHGVDSLYGLDYDTSTFTILLHLHAFHFRIFRSMCWRFLISIRISSFRFLQLVVPRNWRRAFWLRSRLYLDEGPAEAWDQGEA